MENHRYHSLLYKDNGNIENSTTYIINYCRQHGTPCHYNHHKEERQIPQYPCQREQGIAKEGNQMCTVARQGCTQRELHGNRRD